MEMTTTEIRNKINIQTETWLDRILTEVLLQIFNYLPILLAEMKFLMNENIHLQLLVR